MARPILILRVGSQFYGVDIEFAKSVIAPMPLTVMPRAPRYLPGILNLRGAVVPVMDLALRMDAEPSEPKRICIVDCGCGPAGLLVDDVLEVAQAESAESTEDWCAQSPFVGSVVKVRLAHAEAEEESLVLILDLPSLLDARIAA